jgi:hypothetical protein
VGTTRREREQRDQPGWKYWLVLFWSFIWAPFSGMAVWEATQTDWPWSAVLAVAGAIFAMLALWNLVMVVVVGPRLMRTVKEVVETSVGRDRSGELQGPRPIRWWYRRRGA